MRAVGGETTGAAPASNAPARATRTRRGRVKPPSFPARSAGVKGAGRPRDTLRAMGAPGRRLTIAVLTGIVLAGLLPRAWRLTVPGLTSGEAFSWRLAGYPTSEMLARAAQDVHPPLCYLALQGWRALVGDGPAALRALSVLVGLLVVPLAFAL